jgi:hypothetical protein
MDRIAVRLLRFVGLIGMALSLSGLLLMLGIRIEHVTRIPISPGLVGFADALRHVLDGLKEAGVTFLLSAILYALCIMAHNRFAVPPGEADRD